MREGSEQHCTGELPTIVEVLCICAVQYGSHRPRAATEQLDYA